MAPFFFFSKVLPPAPSSVFCSGFLAKVFVFWFQAPFFSFSRPGFFAKVCDLRSFFPTSPLVPPPPPPPPPQVSPPSRLPPSPFPILGHAGRTLLPALTLIRDFACPAGLYLLVSNFFHPILLRCLSFLPLHHSTRVPLLLTTPVVPVSPLRCLGFLLFLVFFSTPHPPPSPIRWSSTHLTRAWPLLNVFPPSPPCFHPPPTIDCGVPTSFQDVRIFWLTSPYRGAVFVSPMLVTFAGPRSSICFVALSSFMGVPTLFQACLAYLFAFFFFQYQLLLSSDPVTQTQISPLPISLF